MRRRLSATEAMRKRIADVEANGEQVLETARSRVAMAKYGLSQQGDPSRIRQSSFPPGWKPRKGTVAAKMLRHRLIEPELVLALELAVEHAERAYGGKSQGLVTQYGEKIDVGWSGPKSEGPPGVGVESSEQSFRSMMMASMNEVHQLVLGLLIRDYVAGHARQRLDLSEIGRRFIPYQQKSQQVAVGAALVKSALQHARRWYDVPKPQDDPFFARKERF